MKANFKITLAAIIGLVTGGSAGFFFQTVDTTEDSAKGDIAKVSKFSKNIVSPAMGAFQEEITSNPEELEKATASLTILTSRMTEFDELVNIAITVSEGKEELATSLRNLQSVSQLAANARTSGNQALEALNAIAEGKKSSVDYEQASRNLALAFMMVDRHINVGKQYVCDVDAFLRGKDIEDYKELALARDLWAGYCAGEARLTNNDDELAYWSKQQNLLTSGTDVLANDSTHFIGDVLKQCIEFDSAIGIARESSLCMSNKEQFEKFRIATNVNHMMQCVLPLRETETKGMETIYD
ncbi:MAG: hypothetical protein MJY50_03555 [Bacteroidales bacterium]|nr:hypothetical protein [Bacteroidales bacterium]